jgi:hypothetical protein
MIVRPMRSFDATATARSDQDELGNEAKVPDSNTIVQGMEAAQRNNPANSRAYTVTRQYKLYKLFHDNDK